MPGYKTHLVGGLLTSIAVLLVLQGAFVNARPVDFLWYVGCSLLGSIFPDIDVASKMQRLFFVVAAGLLSCALLTNRTSWFLVLGGSVLLVTILRHRTLTHQVSFLIFIPFFIAAGAVYLYKLPFNFVINPTIFFVSGCLSHVLLDRTQSRVKRIFSKR